MRFIIGGIQRTSLLDFPDKISAIVFTQGCNFNCGYCHNPDLLNSKKDIYSTDVFFEFLDKRKGKLDGVVITGGEATLQPDLITFIKEIKARGFLVKLDTNGYRPDILKYLLHNELIDYCAMDIKNAPGKYNKTVGLSSCNLSLIQESVSFLLSMTGSFPYEFRTTIVRELHSEDDMHVISEWLKGANAYYLQSYTESDNIIMPGYHSHAPETLAAFRDICLPNIPNTKLRGIDF